MKTIQHLILSICTVLFIGSVSASENPFKSVGLPETWKADIGVTSIKSYSEWNKHRLVSYQKKLDRVVAALRQKQTEEVQIILKYRKEEREAYLLLKERDHNAAIDWIERRSGLGFEDYSRTEPTSSPYVDFKKSLADIAARKAPEVQKVTQVHEEINTMIEKIYDAENELIKKLYAAGKKE